MNTALGQAPEGEFLSLCLYSTGGDLAEAMKLAEVFKGWMMVLEPDAECLSACAILFMSAAARDRSFVFADVNPGRFMHHSARLGFHAPRLEFPETEACRLVDKLTDDKGQCLLTPAEAAALATRAYEDALASFKAIAVPAVETGGGDLDVAAHQSSKWKFADRLNTPISREMPADLLLAFLSVPPDDWYYIERLEEPLGWGIEIYGVPPPPVLSAGMLKSACINVASRRCAQSPDGECSAAGMDAAKTMMKDLLNSGASALKSVEILNEIMTKPVCELAPIDNCASLSATEQEGLRKVILAMTSAALEGDTTIEKMNEKLQSSINFGAYASGVTLGGRRLEAKDLAPLEGKTVTLWPRESAADSEQATGAAIPVVMQMMEVTLGASPVCDARAMWGAPEDSEEYILLDLSIDVAVHTLGQKRVLAGPVTSTSDAYNATRRFALRPWRMLPAGTLLKEIGNSDPWQFLAEGDDVFDKPANWYRN